MYIYSKRMKRRHLHFDSTWLHSELKTKIHAELSSCLLPQNKKENNIFRLKRIFYKLKDTPLIGYDLQVFYYLGLHDLCNAIYVFKTTS